MGNLYEGALNKAHGFTEVPWKDHPGVCSVLRLRTDAKAEDIAIEFVRSFADWLVWPAEFASPLDLDALGCPTDNCCRVALITAAAPEPLLVLAARHCFWKLNMQQLKQICRDEGVEDAPDLYGLLLSLLTFILEPTTDEDLTKILAKRAAPEDDEACEIRDCMEDPALLLGADAKQEWDSCLKASYVP